MTKIFGRRGRAAVMGFFMLALAPADALAQASPVNGALQAASVDTTAKPLGQTVTSAVSNAVTATAGAVSSAVRSVVGPTASVTVPVSTAKPEIAKEAAWLYANGWPPHALIERYAAATGPALDEQANCIAVAVYHEARGESVEGQLAVARVIMNRAASGKYPASWCGTVKQPWQFSFVNPRSGEFPYTDMNSNSWRKAVAVTRLAVSNAIPTLSNDVLWYHADYVAPSWGRRLTRVNKIGTHIFYRA